MMADDGRRECDWYDGRIPVTPGQLRKRAGRHEGPTLFTPYWLGLVVSPEHGGPIKFIFAAVWAFFAAGAPIYGVPWKGVVAAWFLDMGFGIVAALRDGDRRFEWAKFGDGFLKLLVILGVPPVVYHVGEGWGIGGWLAGAVLGLLGFELLISSLRNAVVWWPGLRPVEALLVRIRERGETQIEDAVVVVTERREHDGEDD